MEGGNFNPDGRRWTRCRSRGSVLSRTGPPRPLAPGWLLPQLSPASPLVVPACRAGRRCCCSAAHPSLPPALHTSTSCHPRSFPDRTTPSLAGPALVTHSFPLVAARVPVLLLSVRCWEGRQSTHAARFIRTHFPRINLTRRRPPVTTLSPPSASPRCERKFARSVPPPSLDHTTLWSSRPP